MKIPCQPAFDSFITKFIGILFEPGEWVALACILSDGKWTENRYSREMAIEFLKANRCVPNLYFRASAFDNRGGFSQGNCIVSRAVFLDIDYGTSGHKKTCPFKTLDDVVSYLLTMPILPSIAWHTGHGVQCVYLLNKPCLFQDISHGVENLNRYTKVSKGLANMTMADSAFTPEHAYRVPLTINAKGHMQQDLVNVEGTLLWCHDNVKYSLDELEKAVCEYGIEEQMAAAEETVREHNDNNACAYKALPQDLRDQIETSGTERSDRLFCLIGRMIKSGYNDETILDAMGHGKDFKEKYSRRKDGLEGEVSNCISKIRKGHFVYSKSGCTAVCVYNTPLSVNLAYCEPLPPVLDSMFDAYGEAAGIQLLPRVKDAARFHEHLTSSKDAGVIESPCGTGKSVWAICHIAAGTTSGNQYVYVVETVEALHKAADMLQQLTHKPVGRVHGFNKEKCRELCGHDLEWYDCKRDDSRSACVTCESQSDCSYYTRDRQQRLPVLCMTHIGLIRAIEDASPILTDKHVIIDESLSPFVSLTLSYADLYNMLTAIGESEHVHLLNTLFPGTRISPIDLQNQYGISKDADTFASRNFIFKNERQTADLESVINEFKTILRQPSWAPKLTFSRNRVNTEKARDTLAALINFFRPTSREDATYAYYECKTDGWGVQCKRNTFDFGTGPWGSMWMLNASASLSPFQYPDGMPVYQCPDIPENSNKVTLHCIRANPTQTRQDEAIRISQIAMVFGAHIRKHRKILVCLDKNSAQENQIRSQIEQLYRDYPQPDIMILHRGRIKGSNVAGECTLALLQGMATFTGVNDCALHACLQYRGTFPATPDVINYDGTPNWPGGKMKIPAMRNYYALQSLDEIYQAIWRTAIRNDKPVEAIVTVPDESWLVALYRTVMPYYKIESAYVEKTGFIKVQDPVLTDPGLIEAKDPKSTPGEMHYNWVADNRLAQIGFIASIKPGETIKKSLVANILGYQGENPDTNIKPKSAWEKNSRTIKMLLNGLFEEGDKRDDLKRI